MNKIGVYGGTFDPIHNGHLILARDAVEALGLDKMIFIPAAMSPHKSDTPAAAARIRFQMVRAAIDGESRFEVDDCELHRPPPSYTIDTIEFLRHRETDAQLFYCVGEDNVPGLTSWHRFAELENLVQFVVLDRREFKTRTNYPVIRRHIDISATEIRKRVADGRSIRYLVPHAVEEIIRREELYKESR